MTDERTRCKEGVLTIEGMCQCPECEGDVVRIGSLYFLYYMKCVFCNNTSRTFLKMSDAIKEWEKPE